MAQTNSNRGSNNSRSASDSSSRGFGSMSKKERTDAARKGGQSSHSAGNNQNS